MHFSSAADPTLIFLLCKQQILLFFLNPIDSEISKDMSSFIY